MTSPLTRAAAIPAPPRLLALRWGLPIALLLAIATLLVVAGRDAIGIRV